MEEKEDLLVTVNTKRHKHPPCTYTLPPSLPHHQETQLLCRRTENGLGMVENSRTWPDISLDCRDREVGDPAAACETSLVGEDFSDNSWSTDLLCDCVCVCVCVCGGGCIQCTCMWCVCVCVGVCRSTCVHIHILQKYSIHMQTMSTR